MILSADATVRDRSELLSNGARAYLTKPIGVTDLLGIVDEYMARPA